MPPTSLVLPGLGTGGIKGTQICHKKMKSIFDIVAMVLVWVYPGYIMFSLSIVLTEAMNIV